VKVVVADLGIGNLHSLRKGLEQAGATVEVTPDPRKWLDARALALPGVGAFGAGMRALEPVRGPLAERIRGGTPTLGVCLGLQLLMDSSEESPGVKGLGIIPGGVKRFQATDVPKVPHMGWAPVHHTDGPLFRDIPQDSYFYFVHSFYPAPRQEVGVATTRYGVEFPSVIQAGGTTAAQFHPEKSGPVGLRLLSNWVRTTEAAA